MTLSEAQQKAETAFSGYQSPMSLEEIRKAEEAQKTSSRRSVEAQYAPQILRSKQAGERALLVPPLVN